MDLDLWIAAVKEGQHLAEHELQSLCEYVRSSRLSDAVLPPRFCLCPGHFSSTCCCRISWAGNSWAFFFSDSRVVSGLRIYLLCGCALWILLWSTALCVNGSGEGDSHRGVECAACQQPCDSVWWHPRAVSWPDETFCDWRACPRYELHIYGLFLWLNILLDWYPRFLTWGWIGLQGDFVDRGFNSLEVFTILLLLKARCYIKCLLGYSFVVVDVMP